MRRAAEGGGAPDDGLPTARSLATISGRDPTEASPDVAPTPSTPPPYPADRGDRLRRGAAPAAAGAAGVQAPVPGAPSRLAAGRCQAHHGVGPGVCCGVGLPGR